VLLCAKRGTHRTVAKILAELEVVDLSVTDPPVEEVIGRVFSGGVHEFSIQKTRVLLTSYAYMLEYRAELFYGFCLEACCSSHGSLDKSRLRTIWLSPLDFARYFLWFSSSGLQ